MTESKKHEDKSQDELTDLQTKCDEYLNGWKRAQADYQNLKKEHEDQMKRLTQITNAGLISQLLPIIDHFELAIRHIPENQEKEEWVQGFYHIKKQFDEFLSKTGIKRIATVGKEFDPNLHEAVSIKEGKKENEVLEEIQAGYVLGGFVLRHAKVIVSK